MSRVLREIVRERKSQDALCGLQDHEPLRWLSILAEEFGEASQEVNSNHFGGAKIDSSRRRLRGRSRGA